MTDPSACGRLERCIKLRWLIAGVLFGLTFPMVGWIVAGGLTPTGIANGHAAQPVLFIVDLAPLVLGLTGYGLGIFHSRLIRIRLSIEDTVQTRTAELQQALRDLSETQAELLNAQKMEAIGGLAAGIAHEINTPIQYVSDNTRFVEESFRGLLEVVTAAEGLVESVQDLGHAAGRVEEYQQAATQADIAFLLEEVPAALSSSLSGIDQVAQIVRALKSFAHPGSETAEPGDLNEMIHTTVEVCRNEWKYVAEVDLDGLDPSLPEVPVLAGPFKQVVLNLVMNAAHAIVDSEPGDGEVGSIAISSGVRGDQAYVSVSDSGCGVPEEVRDRIFEPFFTTKDVGRGSGQGLAIARSIVERHHGSITFETEVGSGSTFTVLVPLTETQQLEPAA